MNKKLITTIVTAALAAGTALGAAGKDVVIPPNKPVSARSCDSVAGKVERKALSDRVDKLEQLARDLVPVLSDIKTDVAYMRGRMEQ